MRVYCLASKKTSFYVLSPIINGVVEERICGWGPTLAFFLNDDQHLAREREKIFIYLDESYDAADLYIQRFELTREFFATDCLKTEKEIDEERGGHFNLKESY